jgi:hypothetical protein
VDVLCPVCCLIFRTPLISPDFAFIPGHGRSLNTITAFPAFFGSHMSKVSSQRSHFLTTLTIYPISIHQSIVPNPIYHNTGSPPQCRSTTRLAKSHLSRNKSDIICAFLLGHPSNFQMHIIISLYCNREYYSLMTYANISNIATHLDID